MKRPKVGKLYRRTGNNLIVGHTKYLRDSFYLKGGDTVLYLGSKKCYDNNNKYINWRLHKFLFKETVMTWNDRGEWEDTRFWSNFKLLGDDNES